MKQLTEPEFLAIIKRALESVTESGEQNVSMPTVIAVALVKMAEKSQ
jgi:hypothetical protein